MKTHKIKNTGLQATDICFGTSALGDMPDTYGYAVDQKRAHATINSIFDGPVNFMDTSRNYGMGRSEVRIGEVIRERGGLPDGFVLSTKLDRDMETGQFDASRARRSLEESLEALSLDRVPMLHLHDPEHAQDLAEITGKGGAIDELFKMKEEGLCQAVGLAMGKIEIMFPILREWDFDTLISHNRWTILNRQADEMFDYAHEQGMAILKPLLAETGAPRLGKLVIGTVKGDIHDIGQNLVTMMMEGAGFEVMNIGINNPVENYLEALKEYDADILGMSALLTTTMPYMKVVIDTMKEMGIRDDYVVLVGGAPLNEEFGKAIGADAYCRDAAVAVETAKEFMAKRHNQLSA